MEHLIHSLKRVAGLEPPRVWKEDSIGDAMLSALLAETDIAMAGYEMGTRKETKVRKCRDTDRNAVIPANPWYSHWVIRQLPVRSRRGRPRRPIPAIEI